MTWFNTLNGSLYEGDCQPGDREATEQELSSHQSNSAWIAYQSQAAQALSDSDVVVIRCTENIISVPLEWVEYRKSLRSILAAKSGDATQPLPTKPAYPAGT